jgi:deoxyadenosine/deoxycytidine kinase
MTYIVIEGVIGVGKTTLTRIVGERLNMPVHLEEIDTDSVKHLLGNFYKDRARYAFQTEVFFLLNRYRQQQSVVRPATERGDLVADYLFAKTRLFAGMNLLGDEMALFEQIYDALSKQLERPTLVVYLQASLDTLMARIFQRDRPIERNMDPAYIERLSRLYDDFFASYTGAPFIKIETDHLDIVRDATAQKEVIALITKSARS